MAIQSLGYIGVNATQLDSWKGFACGVMGLEDVSDTLGDGSTHYYNCLLYTSPSPRDLSTSRMPSSA